MIRILEEHPIPLSALQLPRPLRETDAGSPPLPPASARSSENRGSPVLWEVVSVLSNEANG